jgi:hypothetical protein
MIKWLLILTAIGIVAYYVWGPKKVMGTVTALYSDVKVSSPDKVSPGDSAENALLGPSLYNY